MKQFFKKTVSLMLAMTFVLSMAVALPVAAADTVSVAVNGEAVTSGDTISAVSTLVITLPNEMTTEDLATAVTFEEEVKGAETETWSTRLYEGEVNGTTLTVTFSEGDLAMNSNYRFTFSEPAVTGEAQTFQFSTERVGDYYVNENFSRYPEVAASTHYSSKEIASPWKSPVNRSGALYHSITEVEGKKVLRLEGRKGTGTTADNYGAVGYDNAYSPAYTGGTSHLSVSEVEFTVSGNSSSVIEISGILIVTDTETGKAGLYYRQNDQTLTAMQPYDYVANAYNLNHEVASLTATPARHTMKYIVEIKNTADGHVRTLRKLWFDTDEVPLPEEEITGTFHSNCRQNTVSYSGTTGTCYLFAATNCMSAADKQEHEAVYTTLDIYSYSYADYVPNPLTITAVSDETGSTISPVDTLTYTFSEPIDESTLATGFIFEEEDKSAETETWLTRVCDYDLNEAGDVLTVNFTEGDIAANTRYRLRFTTDVATEGGVLGAALTEETSYIYTTSRYGNYYVNDNFSRYPEVSLTNGGNDAGAVLAAPWYNGRNRGSRELLYIVKENDKKFLRLKCTVSSLMLDSANTGVVGIYGAASYHNAYAPAYTGNETEHKAVTEVSFAIAGNETSIFELGGIVILKDPTTEKWTLRVRSGDIIQGTQPVTATADKSIDLGYDIAAPTDQKANHTLKFITGTKPGESHKKTFYKIWLDGNEVPLPEGGISVAWHTPLMREPVNYANDAGLAHLFSATNSRIATGDESGILAYTEMDVYSYKYSTYEPNPLTITAASDETGSTISPVDTLTYTFSEPIDESSLATGFIFEEEDKRYEDTWLTRVCDYALNEDGDVLTVSFTEGDIAANTRYRLRFTTDIASAEGILGAALTEEVSYVYTTSQYGDYYINDNFSRYAVKNYNNNGNTVSTLPSMAIMPYAKMYGQGSGWVWTHAIVEAEGAKALQIKMPATYTGNGNYGYLGYYNGYSPAIPEGTGAYRGTYEFEFDLAGTENSIFELGDMTIAKDAEGVYSLFVRTSGAINGTALLTQLKKLCAIDVPTATPARHTLIYEVTTNTAKAGEKWLHNVYLDGNPVTTIYNSEGVSGAFPATGVSIYTWGQSDTNAVPFTEADPNFGAILAIGNAKVLDADGVTTIKDEIDTVLNVYSIKYYTSGLNVAAADGDSAGAKEITIYNKTGETFNAYAVLAIYSEGTLVGLDGFETAVPAIADGDKATITRTVDGAAAGDTTKVMLFDSKEKLRPLCRAVTGTVPYL